MKTKFNNTTTLGFCSFFCILASFTIASGQELQWASQLHSYSSQSGELRSTAHKVLGKPNATVDSLGNSWFPNSNGKEEFIIVSFSEPLKAKQILIVESTNPGFIRKVSAYDTEGLEYDVASFAAKSSVKGPRLVSVNIADYFINVSRVKVTLVPVRNVSTSIDAIGISTVDKPYVLTKSHLIE